MPRIVILDAETLNPGDNPWDPLAALGTLEVHARTAPDEVVARCAGAPVVITNKVALDAATLAALPDLRYIGITATGHDVVDGAAAAARGVVVTNVPEYGSDTVAEFVFALIFALTRAVARHDAAVRAGEWARRDQFSFWLTPQRELAGLTLGIVGLGRIGRQVARRAAAFDMEVLAATRTPAAPPPEGVSRFERADDIDDLFARADIISLHCPLTPATRGLVDAARLARVRPGALLINTARGALVDEHALAAALRDGRLAGAACDVVSSEPIAPDNPLLGAPNCILTPHMAWATLEARQRLMRVTADNLRAWLDGRPQHVVAGAAPQ